MPDYSDEFAFPFFCSFLECLIYVISMVSFRLDTSFALFWSRQHLLLLTSIIFFFSVPASDH